MHIQHMLNDPKSMKSLERRAVEHLRDMLDQVPSIKVIKVGREPHGPDYGIDALIRLGVNNRHYTLACEVKDNGQPRIVRMAILHLQNVLERRQSQFIPVFIAPYLSPEARSICQEYKVGFLDFEGNCRLVFDGVFIERLVASKPPTERRGLKGIFRPKSAQVLRLMLRDPQRRWRVAKLAEQADVSLGQVSNVRKVLLDKEWAAVDREGMWLSEPEALLDSWREVYEPPAGRRLGFYTTYHSGIFEEAARHALEAANKLGTAMLASFSAAHWLAPYARTGTHFFYADKLGLEVLKRELKLSSAAKGENVFVTRPKDKGLFRDKVETAPGILCTSPVQTYLDLTIAGERGQEAADHLRREKLTWTR